MKTKGQCTLFSMIVRKVEDFIIMTEKEIENKDFFIMNMA